MRRLPFPMMIAIAVADPGRAAEIEPPAAVVAAMPEAERLVAARSLVDVMLPPATRERLLDGMIATQAATMRQAFLSSPGVATAFGDDPRIALAFDDFMRRLSERDRAAIRASMPAYAEVLAHAYARRLDAAQLRDARSFFETPAGKAYLTASFAVTGDADVIAWQKSVMASALSHLQEDMADFARQAAEIKRSACAKPRPCQGTAQ